jgi:hypothetical protein
MLALALLATVTCSMQSSARFPAAFTSADNLVVGPLVMVGAGRFTDAATVERFGGNKFPLLVAAGHRVRVDLPRRTTSMHYASIKGGHRAFDFRACPRGLSTGGGRRVTFWSGFVLTTRPQCVPLRIRVDDERRVRRARIPLGRRCP